MWSPAGVDSSYVVRLNGKEVKKWTLKTSERTDDVAINTIYAMREFLLPSELLTGTNICRVIVTLNLSQSIIAN